MKPESSAKAGRDGCAWAQLVLAVIFGLRTELWIFAGPLAGAALLAFLFGRRLRLGATGQLSIGLAGGLLAAFVALALPVGGPLTLRSSAIGLALGGMLVALPRTIMRDPWLGVRGTAAISCASLLGLGRSAFGSSYLIGLGVFALVQITVLRLEDPVHIPWKQLRSRARWAVGAVLGLSLAVGVALIYTLPPLAEWVEERWLVGQMSQTGFQGGLIQLGALQGMLQSDEMVLELRGAPSDYLRGVAYDRYRDGHWLDTRKGRQKMQLAEPLDPDDGAPISELRTVGERGERFFLPLDAGQVQAQPAAVEVDRLGIMIGARRQAAEWVRFRRGPRVLPLIPPDSSDLQIPATLRPLCDSLAFAWSPDAAPRAVIEALERKLSAEYGYSLSFERSPGIDPVADFLLHHPQGHCEYFAAALALLARSRNIPTRVAGGYRVTERNALTETWVVRERNAHAWVEAWLPGEGWQRFDATPTEGMASHMPSSSGFLGSLAHAVSLAVAGAWDWLLSQSPYALLASVAVLAAFWMGLRWWRERRRRAVFRAQGGRLGFASPLACLQQLEAALAGCSWSRAANESLESFSLRLEAEKRPVLSQASRLLRAYAALRYGGIGDETALSARFEACVSQLQQSTSVEASP